MQCEREREELKSACCDALSLYLSLSAAAALLVESADNTCCCSASAGSQNIRVFVLPSAAYFVNLIKQKRFVCVFFAATMAGHVKWESAYLIAVAVAVAVAERVHRAQL